MDGIFGGDNVHPNVASKVEKYGKEWRRKSKRKQQKLLLIELLYEYAKNSSLHGLGYIVEKGLHLIERGFWFFTVLMSLAMCFYLISNVWMKWKTSPVIVSFSETTVSVGDVPFPSITICPEQKVKATVFNYSKMDELTFSYANAKLKNMTYDNYTVLNDTTTNDLVNNTLNNETDINEADLQKFINLNTVCDSSTSSKVTNEQLITNSVLVDHIVEVAPKKSDIFNYCFWRGNFILCEDIFDEVLTKNGICYNFNALAANEILNEEHLQQDYVLLNTTTKNTDWSMSEGYTNTNEGYPRRGMENQYVPDLIVLLRESQKDRDLLCNVLKNGFTIYVQHPMDLPQASLYYYAVIPEQLTSLALKFNKISTTESLKKYSPTERQCYFPGDRKLRYFKIYTPSNCQLECQSNYTFQQCGCVWFHMPHNNSQEICTELNYFCVLRALGDLAKSETEKHMSLNATSCQCLPSCDSIQYDAEVLKTNLLTSDWFRYIERKHNVTLPRKSEKYSQLNVYFKEPRFISMRRSELFGVTDFLANCGGLLGLFLGFSFLSLVEIFYFGTLRFYYRLKKEIRKEKSKEREIKQQ